MSVAKKISMLLGDYASRLVRSVILVLGSPRAGTTWLAKIIDSHPNILYRHEPDEISAPRADLDPARQLAEWIAERRLPVSGPRPFFRKSWRAVPVGGARMMLVAGLKSAARLPVVGEVLKHYSLPDMIVNKRHENVRALIKLVNWPGIPAALALPDSRSLFILRHPCGQVNSLLRGALEPMWEVRADDRIWLEAAAYAGAHGTNRSAFRALPDAAKYAWAWRAFNEIALEGLESIPNVKLVIYEDLCVQPETVVRDIFSFAGLTWDAQTAKFLAASTNRQEADYFSVFRNSAAMIGRWRTRMAPDAQAQVRSVMHGSHLVRYWPDLAEP
jgi:LPS sulfotransferase NodH